MADALIDFASSNDFRLTMMPTMPAVLSPGQTATFAVTYDPRDQGEDTAALRVAADGVVYTAGLVASVGQPVRTDTFVQVVRSRADVLFVIDNSGSMMEEQASLAASFPAFLSAAQRL